MAWVDFKSVFSIARNLFYHTYSVSVTMCECWAALRFYKGIMLHAMYNLFFLHLLKIDQRALSYFKIARDFSLAKWWRNKLEK